MRKIINNLTQRFILREIGGKGLLVSLKEISPSLIFLNSTAVLVWKTLSADSSVKHCAQMLEKKYDVPKEVAKKDIENLFKEIERRRKDKVKIKNFEQDLKAQNIPIQGSFELTGQCNLNCSHCYAQEERKKANLSLRKVKNIIDQLVENGCLFLQLTGGECLVRKDFKEIYLYLKQVGIIPSVSTNATLLNNDLIRVFERYPPYQIIVSLYGSTGSVHDQITRVDGSFRKTLINVHKLKKASLFVWFSAIVMKENFTQVGAMEKLAERNKIPIIFYPFLIPRLNKDQSPLAHSLSDKRCVWILGVSKKNKSFRQTKLPKRTPEELLYPCNAGWHSFHINAEGKIYICKMERDLGYSLIKNSFKYSWPRLIKIRNLKLRLPKMCLDCQEKKECRVCPPLIRLYLSSKTGPVFCRRVKLKQRAVKSEMPSGF